MNIVHNKDIASLPVYVVVFSSFVFDMWWDKTEGLKKTIFAKVHVYMYIEVKGLRFIQDVFLSYMKYMKYPLSH